MVEERVQRRLAAILAADVVGYSRLIETDEEGTRAHLRNVHSELIAPQIAADGGRIVKTTGDGILAEFPSAVDAVRNALAIQSAMADHNAELPEHQRLVFRLGINVGDVIIEGEDIHGDGVNIAARLEEICQPGEVYVSGTVYDQAAGKLVASFDDLGEQTVKNIAKPVRTYRVRVGLEAEARQEPIAADTLPPRSDKPSIAVLPFENMSGDPEQEYFSDGITEDIITGLSRNRTFFVISRSTTFALKGIAGSVAQVAKDLAVRYVLEGSVRKAGTRVRITAQLIDATTDRHVWADRYDRDLDDIFAVQDEITRNIIGSIAPGILTAEIQRAQRKDATQLNAWDCMMRAHWHIRRFTKEDNAKARKLLSQALEFDPNNAPALADLAFANHFDAVFGWTDSPERSHAQLGEAARKAVGADDHDAFSHTALAIFELFANRHDDAVRRLQKAIDLNPNLAFARGYLGTTYAFAGERDEAMPNLEEAILLSPRDPLMVIWYICMAWAELSADHYNEAVEYAHQAIEVNPEFTDNYAVLAAACGQLDRSPEAGAALDELRRRMPDLTASDNRLRRPFSRPIDRNRFIDGLRKAGLPG